MSNLEKAEQLILNEKEYILHPFTYIAPFTKDLNSSDKCYLLALILKHNVKFLKSLELTIAELESLKNTPTIKPDSARVLVASGDSSLTQSPQSSISINQSKIDNVLSLPIDKQLNVLKSLSSDELITFKLFLLRSKKELQKELYETILINPLQNVISLQNELANIDNILKLKIPVNLAKDENTTKLEPLHPKVIFVPSPSKQSYFAIDIALYPERQKEIKLIFDKITSGFFLERKGIKSLEGYTNLHEFSSPNGARVLYSLINDKICILSLFWKDKQKSKKITSYYIEAKNRFTMQEQYLKDNIGTPDFEIEQLELLGQINALLENDRELTKKVGDQNA